MGRLWSPWSGSIWIVGNELWNSFFHVFMCSYKIVFTIMVTGYVTTLPRMALCKLFSLWSLEKQFYSFCCRLDINCVSGFQYCKTLSYNLLWGRHVLQTLIFVNILQKIYKYNFHNDTCIESKVDRNVLRALQRANYINSKRERERGNKNNTFNVT